MISRYSRPAAVAIWSQETKYRIWFEIEAHAATKMAELGVIPTEAAEAIWAKGKDVVFDADRIDELERTTKHDVIAFLTYLSEAIGPEARFLHQGMTSSDVLDTTLAVQLARASDLLLADLDRLLAALDLDAEGKNPRMAWQLKRGAPYVPTGLYADGLLYLWSDSGILTCANPDSGETIWSERAGGDYYGSPVLAGGRLWATSARGELVSAPAGRNFGSFQRVSLGEASHATPAVAGGRLFVRTLRQVFCL